MYTVLTGAKVNIGDFLITDRCKKLLRHFRSEHELFQLPHWEPLDKHLDKINSGSAIIIMGGPGYQPDFYPKIYKLTRNLSDIKVPIIPMGLGWKGFPGDYETLKNYRFTESSLMVLKRISGKTTYLGCRDYLTKEALILNGIQNVLMTGCPVWYDLDSINKEMKQPNKIRKIVFTPAQLYIYRQQSIDVMKMLRSVFPNADLFCSFHRGIMADNKFTLPSDEENNLEIKRNAEILGFKIVDASFDLKRIAFYDECDFHVGYRVHAHLYFLSKRMPSILIHEDGRGRGVSDSINVIGVDAFKRTVYSAAAQKTELRFFSKLVHKFKREIEPDENTVLKLRKYLQQELESGFIRFSGVSNIIDNNFKIMKKFIESLPA